MDIYEANNKLIRLGNAMITQDGTLYYVTPRTVKNIKSISNYESFITVDEAFDYAEKLHSNWCMDE